MYLIIFLKNNFFFSNFGALNFEYRILNRLNFKKFELRACDTLRKEQFSLHSCFPTIFNFSTK